MEKENKYGYEEKEITRFKKSFNIYFHKKVRFFFTYSCNSERSRHFLCNFFWTASPYFTTKIIVIIHSETQKWAD